jgi:hypothetical protein
VLCEIHFALGYPKAIAAADTGVTVGERFFGYPFRSDNWRSVFGIGTEEVIRVGGPRHVSHAI